MDTGKLFTRSSYEAILYGMNFLDDGSRHEHGATRPDSVVYETIEQRLAVAPHKLPPHDVWLQKVLGMPSYPHK